MTRKAATGVKRDKGGSIFYPSVLFLKEYRDCLKRQRDLRKRLALPKDDKEDKRFCEHYHRLYLRRAKEEGIMNSLP